MTEHVDHLFLEFDRKLFVEEILNVEYSGDIAACARAMEMSPAYLHELVYHTTMRAGKVNLTRILRYCVRTGKDPLRYLTKAIM